MAAFKYLTFNLKSSAQMALMILTFSWILSAQASLSCLHIFSKKTLIIDEKAPFNEAELDASDILRFRSEAKALRQLSEKIQKQGSYVLRPKEFETLYSSPLLFQAYQAEIRALVATRDINKDIANYTSSSTFLRKPLNIRRLYLNDVSTSLMIPGDFRGQITLAFKKVQSMLIPEGVTDIHLPQATQVSDLTFSERAPQLQRIDMPAAQKISRVKFPTNMSRDSTINLFSAVYITNTVFPKTAGRIDLTHYASLRDQLKDTELNSLAVGVRSLEGVSLPKKVKQLSLDQLEVLPDHFPFSPELVFLSFRKLQSVNRLDLSQNEGLYLSMPNLQKAQNVVFPTKMRSLFLNSLLSLDGIQALPKHIEDTISLGVRELRETLVLPISQNPSQFIHVALYNIESAYGIVFPEYARNLILPKMKSFDGFYGPKAMLALLDVSSISVPEIAVNSVRLPLLRSSQFNIRTKDGVLYLKDQELKKTPYYEFSIFHSKDANVLQLLSSPEIDEEWRRLQQQNRSVKSH